MEQAHRHCLQNGNGNVIFVLSFIDPSHSKSMASNNIYEAIDPTPESGKTPFSVAERALGTMYLYVYAVAWAILYSYVCICECVGYLL